MEKKDFKKNETKKLIIGGVICFAILIGALGYTYSYFSASATNNSVITGRVESTVLTLNVSEVVPNNGAKLVPQRDSAITKAVTGVNGKCIDGNNNTICKVYSVTIKNISTTAPVNVNATLELNAGSNPNLKWAEISGTTSPTLVSSVFPHTTTSWLNEVEYQPNEERTYYLVMWISEKQTTQNDTGNFTGVLTVENAAPEY